MCHYGRVEKQEGGIASRLVIDREGFEDFLKSIMAGDRRVCVEFVDSVFSRKGDVIAIYEEVFRPALYEVGRLWENNKISVATEHVASAMVEFLMGRLYAGVISDFRRGQRVIVACAERELHQIGAKMVCDVFEMNGWDALFVGGSAPRSELIRMLDEERPQFCALSLSVYMNLGNFLEMIGEIRAHFPDIPILVGGQALQSVTKSFPENYPGITRLQSLYELDTFLRQRAGLDDRTA